MKSNWIDQAVEEDNDDRIVGKFLSRREVVAIAGAAGLAAFMGCGGGGGAGSSTEATAGATTATTATTSTAGGEVGCVLVSPEMTEGPYFVDELLNRSDIRTDTDTGVARPGKQLDLIINLVSVASTCTAITGAMVDVWHCDAGGLYSDVSANSTVGLNFLRGYQLSNSDGKVTFTTIYPGWYSGRAVHIHFKVRLEADGQDLEFTSQLFFDETITTAVHSQSPYNTRGTRDTINSTDNIYQGGGNMTLLALTETANGYQGTISIGMVL